MGRLRDKIRKFWYFRIANPVVRKGEKGGFKWRFRRYDMKIETLSGNFKAEWTADVHPYAYLLAGKDDENIHGFAERMYMVGKLLTTEQKFVGDIDKALKSYQKRLDKQAAKAVEDDEVEEKAALEFEKSVQEFVELPEKEKKNVVRDINKRFKKAAKEAEDEEQAE